MAEAARRPRPLQARDLRGERRQARRRDHGAQDLGVGGGRGQAAAAPAQHRDHAAHRLRRSRWREGRASSLEAALAIAAATPDVESTFVVGGAEIFRDAFAHAELRYIYLTRVQLHCGGDTHIPDLDRDFAVDATWDGEQRQRRGQRRALSDRTPRAALCRNLERADGDRHARPMVMRGEPGPPRRLLHLHPVVRPAVPRCAAACCAAAAWLGSARGLLLRTAALRAPR